MKTSSRGNNAVTSEMTAAWTETTLPTILSKYKLNDIFNADKFGIFYQYLFKKTNTLSSEMCSVGINSKFKLTGMAAASVTREKLEVLVIGKSSSAKCFRHVKNLNFS